MAATKRNAGLTSAVHRATLNDEELVSQTTNSQVKDFHNFQYGSAISEGQHMKIRIHHENKEYNKQN